MKAELRLVPHTELPGEQSIEVLYDGRLIGAVYGADGPGIRFITKHGPTETTKGMIGIAEIVTVSLKTPRSGHVGHP